MKKIILFLFFNTAYYIAFSQNPLVKMWDKRFGGTAGELLYDIQQTSDRGFILAGISGSSIGGNKTQPLWGSNFDYWIVKTDSLGIQQWDRDLGGMVGDYLTSIDQTSDGGFIIGGYTTSGIGGNKTQDSWGINDYWVVKTDYLGNIQWDKDFGGTDYDDLYSVQQTSDGGFILGGWSRSGISGDKTQATRGGADYWIVKTDSLGNKQWDKDYGGDEEDLLYSVQQTSDGGFILGGYSWSGISGDKTQTSKGLTDYWIVKTDSLGNKQWDKGFGGSKSEVLRSIHQTTDGGFILGGRSNSGISWDKTQASWGQQDFWIVKTDSLGNKQWDKDFGGAVGEDEFGNITQTSDGGFLLAGISNSDSSGNKMEDNLGVIQSWVLKTDSLGNVLWDKTIFTNAHDPQGLAIQTNDGCYLVGNYTTAGIGGYKTQASQGVYDYWIVKFCEVLQAGFTSPNFICPGSCIDFTNLSFQAASYQWSFPGASPDNSTAANPANICYANPGSYDVQLIASNVTGSDTLLINSYITVYPQPPPQSIIQSGDTLFALPGFTAYQWFHDGVLISGATGYYLSLQDSGDFNVIATDTNGCEVEAVIYDVHIGIDEYGLASSNLQLEIFPNPVIEKFTIHSRWLSGSKVKSGTAFEISIYNVMGEEVQRQESRFKNQEILVDVSSLHPGIYFLEMTTTEKSFRTKFVKQ